MKSDMHESDSSLVALDYNPYLKLLQEIVQQTSLFAVSPQVLRIESAALAHQMAEQAKAREGTREALPELFRYTIGTRVATIHLAGGDQALHAMGKHIETLHALIRTQLTTSITASTLPPGSPDACVSGLLRPLSQFHRPVPQGLSYPFLTKQALSKRRVHIHSQTSRPPAADLRYRGHKVTITLGQTNRFEDDLIDGLCLLAQSIGASPNDVTEIRSVLQQSKQDPGSEIARLRKIVKEETLGKIKGEACWQFWDGVIEDMARTHARLQSVPPEEQAGLIELQRQLRMLTRFRTFLGDASKPDSLFQVTYMDEPFDVRTIFGRSISSYGVLPLIPEIAGTLGEVQDLTKDEQIFAYGIRFKLNGAVGKIPSAFQYYAALLDPEHTDHQVRLENPFTRPYFAEEVIRIAVLYFVLFGLDDDGQFEGRLERFLGHLAGDDAPTKRKMLQQLSQRLLRRTTREEKRPQIEVPVEQAKKALRSYFSHASVGPTIDPFSGYLILQNGMLRINRDRMVVQKRFFHPELFTNEEQRKKALRYITVQDAIPQQNAFYALPLRIAFAPIYLSDSASDQPEKAEMLYAIDDWMMLPVLFVPDDEKSRRLVERAYARDQRILVTYQEQTGFAANSLDTAIYRWAFLLLTYLCLEVLWEHLLAHLLRQHKRLFFPMIRIHQQEQETEQPSNRYPNEGTVLRGMTKTLAHLFSCERVTLSNAQGFTHGAFLDEAYKLGNGLSSLYHVLPRVITRPSSTPNELDKLAIIVISSRQSDWHSNSAYQEMCVYGEIIGCTRLPDGKLRVEQLSTFVNTDNSTDLYRTPGTLLDQVRRCSNAGYKHIFYMAKAPYTSHVHLTSQEDGDELYFMSPKLIGGVLEAYPEVKLYPMFCDRYYVAKVNSTAMKESLYVDDTKELRILFTDPSKSTVVFFNVMNGIHVSQGKQGNREKSFYHGVVSYATLINMYANPLYDQAIRNNLLDESQPGSLRKDMLDYLAYVHGVRYERREKEGVQLKLDPYEAIIGVESVGARAIIPGINPVVQTNMLAFLTLVRGRLRRRRQAPGAPAAPSPSSAETSPSSETVDGSFKSEEGESNANQ